MKKREKKQDKRRDKMKKKREDEREKKRENEERDERKDDFSKKKKFEDPQTRQMNQPNMFRTKSFSDELFLHFSSKVQNQTVYSIVYMIRIRFFGPGELFQKGFRGAQ